MFIPFKDQLNSIGFNTFLKIHISFVITCLQPRATNPSTSALSSKRHGAAIASYVAAFTQQKYLTKFSRYYTKISSHIITTEYMDSFELERNEVEL